MKRDDWMLLSLTFLTGLAIGMYVYIVAFKPTYVPEDLNTTEVEASEWSVVGKKRMESDQSGYVYPSFRLLGDGSYVYLPGGNSTDSLEPIEGSVSSGLIRELKAESRLMPSYTADSTTSYCGGDSEGYEYEYRVTIENRNYVLDTCYTALSHDSEYANLLAEVWMQIEGRGESRSYESFSEWAQSWLRSNIGVE